MCEMRTTFGVMRLSEDRSRERLWHRDHLDPCMRELRGPGGPFASCTKNEHTVVHRLPAQVSSAWWVEA
ncbi:DUF4913 domain-containing protein [Streptomyces massasporeus]|uniref:DUF4913 domain-containing protein n=1 Tax=Streptomyces massasporeus TaxID=67324 RepID=UPI0033BB77DC